MIYSPTITSQKTELSSYQAALKRLDAVLCGYSPKGCCAKAIRLAAPFVVDDQLAYCVYPISRRRIHLRAGLFARLWEESPPSLAKI